MSLDLFCGMAVRDLAVSIAWYERFLGGAPSFFPNDAEAVWELAEHRYVYIVVQAGKAGHGVATAVVADYDSRLAAIAARGLEPTEVETYDNGVRKAIFHDPDGNEFGLGGMPG